MSADHSEGLDQVYAARSTEELARAYDVWSATYDGETLALGYCLPFVVTSWLARHVGPKEGPVLDAGCGSGLSGSILKALGYEGIEGLDMSPSMLAHARGRGAYDDLKEGMLGTRLPWDDHHFRAFFSTGVFTEGHAPADGLVDLVRITRPGGHAIFTIRDSVMEKGGFSALIERLEREGRWQPVEASPLFRAFAIAEPEVLVRTFVFRIL